MNCSKQILGTFFRRKAPTSRGVANPHISPGRPAAAPVPCLSRRARPRVPGRASKACVLCAACFAMFSGIAVTI